MRWQVKVMVLAVLGFVTVGLSTAQQPFGGFGGFTKGPSGPAALIQNESVKKELRLTDEQAAKIPDAVMKALGEVLDPDQMKRFKQIDLQVKGAKAFADPAVQTSLKMTNDQKDNIKSILAESDMELVTLAKELAGGGADFKGMRDKMAAITKETKDRVNSVLTGDQKRMWQEMIGDEFKLEAPRFDFGKKKKDS
jgi:hypothetical protein